MREWGVVCLYDPDENYDEDGEANPVGDAAWWRRLTRAFTPPSGTEGGSARGGPGNGEAPAGWEHGGRGGLQDAETPDGSGRSARESGTPDDGSGTRPAGSAGGRNDGPGEGRGGSFGRFAAGHPGECPAGDYDYGSEDADGWAFLEALGRMVSWLAATLAASRETGDPWEPVVTVEAVREPIPVRPPEPPPPWHRPQSPFRGL
ncbi:MAG: hypothetical protein KA419_20110 [Acidobacteria bacterium]|nr:hypothetical protein [Acidobacteriota bacterium]